MQHRSSLRATLKPAGAAVRASDARASYRAITTLAVLALALSGCAGPPSNGAQHTQGSRSPSPAPMTAGAGDSTLQTHPHTAPYWDQDSRTAAITAAVTAMRAFARPHVDPTTWFEEIAPLLSPTARGAYYATDPARIPARSLAGPARLVDDTSPYLAGVLVPTDAGAYLVLVSRGAHDDSWLVEQITPPTTGRGR